MRLHLHKSLKRLQINSVGFACWMGQVCRQVVTVVTFHRHEITRLFLTAHHLVEIIIQLVFNR